MGLVDYGSDSDSDSPQSTPAPAPAPPTRAKRRILLDLPAPSASASATGTGTGTDAQGPSKRFKSDTARGDPSPPLTGLAAMLPKPKNSSAPRPPPPAPAPTKAAEGPSRLEVLLADKAPKGNEAMLLPPAIAAKRKQAPPPAPAPAADFFGISSVASSSSGPATSTSSSKQPSSLSSSSFSAAPSISSAPAPKPQPSSSSTAKPKEEDDPYPGFTQLPSGEWVAKDQKTYEMWMAWQQAQQAQQQQELELAAEGLDEKDLKARGGLVDVKPPPPPATGANAAVPGGRAEGYLPATQLKGIPSQLSGSAKRKHQLSSLLAAAHDNRAELEDRIAQARQNRKSGANKYGF